MQNNVKCCQICVAQSWHILPKTRAQVFQYWGDRTDYFLYILKKNFQLFSFKNTYYNS